MRNIPIKSMNRISDSFLLKKHPDFYAEIYKIDGIMSLSERVWLYKNELNKIPTCPNCNKKELKFKNLTIGFRKFCSKKCAAEYSHKNPIIKTKRINNMLQCNYDNKKRLSMTKKANDTKKNFSNDKKNEINKKRENTVNKKYGVNNVSKNKKILEKIKKNIIITKNKNRDLNFSKRIEKIGYKLLFCEKDELSIKDNNCEHEFNINRSLFNQRNRFNVTVCTICNPINNHISDFQNKIKIFISSIYSGEIIDNKKYGNYEIDIFLPKMNIGFECNGLWWHSELYREKEYHINKINYFKNKNITIINIWEDWWKNKSEIIKSIILNKLIKTPDKIYARKTEIKEITDNKLVKDFLEKNHIQGFVGSKVKIGLFYNNELVSLMTFGNNRISMGKKSSDNEYELLRFCNKIYTNVIGGASKLFNYFIKTYTFSKITTYADLSISNGNLYKKLNMSYESTTKPNYSYFHKDIGIKVNRFNFRKDILVKQGYDRNKTESEIMKERNYYKIYDSGNLKFKYDIIE
jgi:hypothetical protein